MKKYMLALVLAGLCTWGAGKFIHVVLYHTSFDASIPLILLVLFIPLPFFRPEKEERNALRVYYAISGTLALALAIFSLKGHAQIAEGLSYLLWCVAYLSLVIFITSVLRLYEIQKENLVSEA